MKGHTGAVRSVNFSEDSQNLITASDDKTAKVTPDSSFPLHLLQMQSSRFLFHVLPAFYVLQLLILSSLLSSTS